MKFPEFIALESKSVIIESKKTNPTLVVKCSPGNTINIERLVTSVGMFTFM